MHKPKVKCVTDDVTAVIPVESMQELVESDKIGALRGRITSTQELRSLKHRLSVLENILSCTGRCYEDGPCPPTIIICDDIQESDEEF